jgi:hypothetical protein
MQQCANRASPSSTAAEDIHPVYKSPREHLLDEKTITETTKMSFLLKINRLFAGHGQIPNPGQIDRGVIDKKNNNFCERYRELPQA